MDEILLQQKEMLVKEITELKRCLQQKEIRLKEINWLLGSRAEPSTTYFDVFEAGETFEQPNNSVVERQSWWQKVQAIFIERRRLFYATEVLQILIRDALEQQLTAVQVEKLKKNVWAVFTNKTKAGELCRIKKGKEYLYGLSNWFDNDGNVLPEYRLLSAL